MKTLTDWKFALMLALTLGLAPFVPEPHIVGKLRWVLGGAHGMQLMDWLDLVLHGTPWLLLIWVLVRIWMSRRAKAEKEDASGWDGKE